MQSSEPCSCTVSLVQSQNESVLPLFAMSGCVQSEVLLASNSVEPARPSRASLYVPVCGTSTVISNQEFDLKKISLVNGSTPTAKLSLGANGARAITSHGGGWLGGDGGGGGGGDGGMYSRGPQSSQSVPRSQMAPSEPTWPSWQWRLPMNFEPFPKEFRQVFSQIIGGAAGGGEGGGDGDGGGGEGDGGGGEGDGGGAGGEECNVTVPPSQEIRATLAAHLSLVLSMALAQASPESPCRLRPEWNSACVLRGGRLIVWPGLGTTRSLPPSAHEAER